MIRPTSLTQLNPASTFLYGVGGIFAGVLAYQSVVGHPLDVVAVGVLTSIVGFVIHSNGNQQGTDNANSTVAKTAIAQYPLTPEGIASEVAKHATGGLPSAEPPPGTP